MRENPNPLVTIAIPTYNRANTYLPQALHSVLHQTYSNIEVLVADNCSTDNTESVVKAFHDPRITYCRQKQNIGPFQNAKFCIQKAHGDFFLMLQDDDLIDPDMIEVCLQSVNYSAEGVGIIRTGVRWISGDGTVLVELPNRAVGLSLDGFFRAFFANKTGIYLCSTVFNTKRLQEIGGFQSKNCLFYDVMAAVTLAARYGREDIYDIKASNRKHASELTWSTTVNGWCEDSLDLIHLMCDLVPENKDLVKAEGMRGLSVYNYNLTGKIPSPLKRIRTYWMVYKNFDYAYSPVHLLYNKTIGSFMNAVKRKVKQVLLAT
jgi:glycosyltransferase involved in cell wall biosynthesis